MFYEAVTGNTESFVYPSFCIYGFIPKGIEEGTADFFTELFQNKKGNNRNNKYIIGKYVQAKRFSPVSYIRYIN